MLDLTVICFYLESKHNHVGMSLVCNNQLSFEFQHFFVQQTDLSKTLVLYSTIVKILHLACPPNFITELLYVPYVPDKAEGLILQNRNILADQMSFLSDFLPKHSRVRQLVSKN